MAIYVILSIATIAVVGTAATIAIYLGLLNWFGEFHMVHCKRCHHLTGSLRNEPKESCLHCRHPMLMHPLYAMQHRAAPVRVRPDPLRY